ncbi:hypothetical protein GGR92_004194 [Spirosoma lacussanchae]|uniref:hypothetical protein n=1 Tax=Spirosoma lacussanchae TaxID=1884249 RepID=UPI001109D1D7|nr:hypothetical protein [Spirosoma lacussanchae]
MLNNNFLKGLLIAQTVVLLIYSAIAFKNDGSDLLAIFFANIQSLNWNGQFNLDFSCYLVLSGLWIIWRNKFSVTSIVLAVIASIVGIMIFAPYLLYLLIKEKGDLKSVLIGVQ